MMLEKPEQSEKLFVDWVEYAARNPGLHKILNLPGAELTPFWYYSGDVIVVTFIFSMTSIFIFWRFLNFMRCRISIRSKSKSE
ncbi:hypothetical protein B9Z55_014939 [Caenorhabditis nigoni]|nr:hypothetical protein B9Z55_014939 [Caenorhabditis nigoni]